MKFPSNKAGICIVHVDIQTAQKCYVVGLKMTSYQPLRKACRLEVAMADLEPQTDINDKMEPQGETKEMEVGGLEGQVRKLRNGLNRMIRKR